MASATLTAPPERSDARPRPVRGPVFSCDCGHEFWVFGGGRHRIYFELSDERSNDAVMNRVCPACARGLPGKNPA